MKKYCYLTRIEAKFKTVDIKRLDDLEIGGTFYDEAISIGIVDGDNIQEIEQKAKQILNERFKQCN